MYQHLFRHFKRSSYASRITCVLFDPATHGFHTTSNKPLIPKVLLDAIHSKAEETLFRFNALKRHKNIGIGSVDVGHVLSGLHGTPLLICETSEIDAHKGVSYRGIPIQDLVERLPGAEDYTVREYSHDSFDSNEEQALEHQKSFVNSFPLSEGLVWLFLSGEIPDHDRVALLQAELFKRRTLPPHVIQLLSTLCPQLHPMTQFIIGITACQAASITCDLIRSGRLQKSEYWTYFLDDGLSLIAKAPSIASIIYNRLPRENNLSQSRHRRSETPLLPDDSVDWAANVARGMGFDSPAIANVMRLHMFLHADHEGGNVSAHAGHLVGSALSDPYLSFSAGLTGLAGPLHGMANQTCLQFLRKMHDYFYGRNCEPTDKSVALYIKEEYLQRKRVVPGFGHAVLRTVDPRFLIQKEFFNKISEKDTLGRLLDIAARVVPPLLLDAGKVSNPYPNVDAHSGVILNHYGISEQNFFTVLFGLSRSLGIVSQLVWDRILQLPIERPKSVTLNKLNELASLTSP